ncbi:MAG: TRAP transporter small permease [Pseudomonadota bacterium]
MRRLETLAAQWALFGGVILALIVAVTVTNATAFAADKIARLFDASVSGLPGYEDFVQLAIGSAAPMLLPYCQARGGHLAVDLFTANAGPRFNAAVDAITHALMAFTALFLAYWMVLGMLETRSDGALSRVLGWQVWPFYIPGILSLILWALVCLGQLVTGAPKRGGASQDDANQKNARQEDAGQKGSGHE